MFLWTTAPTTAKKIGQIIPEPLHFETHAKIVQHLWI